MTSIDWRIGLGISILAIVLLGSLVYAGVPFAGGGEVISAMSLLDVDDNLRYPSGQHIVSDWDTDGNFEDYNWTYETTVAGGQLKRPNGATQESIQNPGISVTTTNPYNIKKVGESLVALGDEDEPEPVTSYEKVYTINGEETIYRYFLMYYGFDVTIKTTADTYFKDRYAYNLEYVLSGDWGYYFEDNVVDVELRQNFRINPWSPVGVWNSTTTEDNMTTTYQIQNGWTGILDSQVYVNDIGLVDESLEGDVAGNENFGHTIQNIIETGTSLNMYVDNAAASTYSFNDERALKDIPTAVDVELGATLGAGAQYHVDTLGHWDSVAVRNVKVQYKVLVKAVATLEMVKLVTTGTTQGGTKEDNTFYKPQVPVVSDLIESWNEFWADVDEWLRSPEGIFYSIILVAGAILVIYVVLKITGRVL